MIETVTQQHLYLKTDINSADPAVLFEVGETFTINGVVRQINSQAEILSVALDWLAGFVGSDESKVDVMKAYCLMFVIPVEGEGEWEYIRIPSHMIKKALINHLKDKL